MNRAPRAQQWHDDGEERLDGMPPRIIPQIPEHTLQLVHQIANISIARPAPIVGGAGAAAEDAARGAATTAAAAEEG